MGKKIKINKLPPGFKIQNGKVVKVMAEGGNFVTGDQVDYGLVTTYDNNGNGETDRNVRYSLGAVPREFANIEAEGGETVLTDLNNNGTFGLYDIKGKRHSQGGVPMYLPDQSFIFSDTKALKMKPNELAEFGIESKKHMTPAKVSKNFQLNEFISAAGDPDSDFITEKSAELMLDKNMMSLSKLAFGQEVKKGFEEGVPLAAFPYIQSMGEDPMNFAAMIDAQIAQRKARAEYGGEKGEAVWKARRDAAIKASMAKGRDGGEPDNEGFRALPNYVQEKIMDGMPKAQEGNETGTSPGQPTANTDIPTLPEYAQETLANLIQIAQNSGMKPEDLQTLIQQMMTAASDPNAIQDVVNTVNETVQQLGEGRIPVISDIISKIDKSLKDAGIEVRPNMDVGDPGIADMQPSNRETGLYGDVGMDNLPQWFENNRELLTQGMGYESYDDLVAKEGEDWFKNKDFVRDFQNKKNESLTARYDNDPELRAKLDELGISKDQFVSEYGFDANTEKGPNAIDGLFGEYTLNRKDFVNLPGVEEEEVEEEEEVIDTPVGEEFKTDIPDFWRQDLALMDANAKRDFFLGLPDRQAVERQELNPALMDPTRQIAAINEQAAIGADAAGLFGPQTVSANTARNTGNAFKNIANIVSKYDAANVGILNKADMAQATLDNRNAAAERKNYAEMIDGTNLALDNYTKEKNLQREQFAELYANALTNRANTYNLNTLIPYYDINPRTGGMIENVDSKKILEAMQPQDPYANIENLAKAAKMAKAFGLSDELVTNLLMPNMPPANQNSNSAFNMLRANSMLPQSYAGNNVNTSQGRHGIETKVKRGAKRLPFFIGKMLP